MMIPGIAALLHPAATHSGVGDELKALGPIGLWYMDQYQSSPRPYVPNAVAATTAPANIFAQSRRYFSSTIFWRAGVGGGHTATDNAATAPDGTSQASTIVSSNTGWYLSTPSTIGTLPAGTYTLACSVKRNTGTDQTFAFWNHNSSTRVTSVTVDGVPSQPTTATSAWKRFAYTFTLSSSLNFVNAVWLLGDGTTQTSLQICDLELFSGSSDLGPETGIGHMCLGYSAYGSLPTYASGKLDFSTGPAFARFSSPSTLSSFTACAVVRRSTGGSYHGIASKVSSFASFTATSDVNGIPSRLDTTAFDNAAGLFNLIGKGWNVITHRYNATGTRHDLFINNVNLVGISNSLGSFACDEIGFGYVNSILSKLEIACVALYGRALSDSEIRG